MAGGQITKMKSLLIFNIFVLLGTVSGISAEKKLCSENFETEKWKNSFKLKNYYTATSSSLDQPGHLSGKCLKIDKPDTCGTFSMKRKTLEASGGHWLQVSMDIKVLQKGPYAEYFIFLKELDKNRKTLKNHVFAFDNGIVRKTNFGGSLKTPQTMGEWQTTIHNFQTKPQTDTIELSVNFRGGSQTALIDNLNVVDQGKKQPPQFNRAVFSKKIDWPYAFLELDMLTPGCVYEIDAGYKLPAAKSDKALREGSRGMGVRMTSVNFKGKESAPVALAEMPDRNGRKVFRFAVPEDAMKIYLELYNDDLITFNHHVSEKYARRWTDVFVYLYSSREITRDNTFWQYIYRGRPENLKVRNIIELKPFALQVLKEILRTRSPAKLNKKKINGGMCLEINGKLYPPVLASHEQVYSDMAVFRQLAKNGIKLMIVRYPYGGPVVHGDWTGKGKYDFTDLDNQVYKVLLQNPDAFLIISIDNLYPPDWWCDRNPGELARDQNGLFCWCRNFGLYQRIFGTMDKIKAYRKKYSSWKLTLRGAKGKGHFLPSAASRKAHEAVGVFIDAMCRHINSKPYGKTVVGYRFLAGYDGQFGWVRNDYGKPPHCLDYSKPMLRRFRSYLKEKYRNVEALRKAWRNKSVTFDNAALPGIKGRNIDQYKGNPYLLDPAKYQNVIDYRECDNIARGEMINAYAGYLKKSAGKNVLVMAYYPDISESCTGSAGHQRGTETVMSKNLLDSGGGPSYEARDIGLGNKNNTMLNSFPLNNKIAFTELDHRIFPVMKRNYANNILFDTARKSLSVLRREFMKQMCFGGGIWTFDMGIGWYNDPLIAQFVGNANKQFAEILNCQRQPVGMMAIFAGEQPKNVQADARRGAIPKILLSGTKAAAMHCGIPIGQYQFHDLPKVADKYKIFFFPLAYGLTEIEKKNIEALKKNGNLLVFGYGSGYVTGASMNIKNIEALTGFKLRENKSINLTVNFDAVKHPITKYVKGFMGSAGNKSFQAGLSRFYVNDPQAKPLAYFVSRDGEKLPGIAFKNHGNWQSIYIGTVGLINHNLLRGIAEFKGENIYNKTGDVMFFCKNLIALHASSTGRKTIELPRKAFVTSLWDGKKLGKVKRIVRDMKVGQNAFYLIQPEQTLKRRR